MTTTTASQVRPLPRLSASVTTLLLAVSWGAILADESWPHFSKFLPSTANAWLFRWDCYRSPTWVYIAVVTAAVAAPVFAVRAWRLIKPSEVSAFAFARSIFVRPSLPTLMVVALLVAAVLQLGFWAIDVAVQLLWEPCHVD